MALVESQETRTPSPIRIIVFEPDPDIAKALGEFSGDLEGVNGVSVLSPWHKPKEVRLQELMQVITELPEEGDIVVLYGVEGADREAVGNDRSILQSLVAAAEKGESKALARVRFVLLADAAESRVRGDLLAIVRQRFQVDIAGRPFDLDDLEAAIINKEGTAEETLSALSGEAVVVTAAPEVETSDGEAGVATPARRTQAEGPQIQ